MVESVLLWKMELVIECWSKSFLDKVLVTTAMEMSNQTKQRLKTCIDIYTNKYRFFTSEKYNRSKIISNIEFGNKNLCKIERKIFI